MNKELVINVLSNTSVLDHSYFFYGLTLLFHLSLVAFLIFSSGKLATLVFRYRLNWVDYAFAVSFLLLAVSFLFKDVSSNYFGKEDYTTYYNDVKTNISNTPELTRQELDVINRCMFIHQDSPDLPRLELLKAVAKSSGVATAISKPYPSKQLVLNCADYLMKHELGENQSEFKKF